MTPREEKEHWIRMVNELQEHFTLQAIAQHVGVDEREVYRWKAGERRPMGMRAVRIHILHAKYCLTSAPLAITQSEAT